MKNRYIIRFKKQGFIRYTSHLDLLRVFKRAFKRSGIALEHSKGFNPHPKIVFAQPLSLGVTASEEFLQFETVMPEETDVMMRRLAAEMPEGLVIFSCDVADEGIKSIAALVTAADYTLTFPEGLCEVSEGAEVCDAGEVGEGAEVCDAGEVGEEIAAGVFQSKACEYFERDEITALKRKKKKKGRRRQIVMVEQDIKPLIHRLTASYKDGQNVISVKVDCGSESNLNPDLIIKTFIDYAGLDVEACDVEINRDKLYFTKDLI